MGLANEILIQLKGMADANSIKKFNEYEAASLMFHKDRYDDVIRELNNILMNIAKDGEVISSSLGEGKVVDSGSKHLDVVRGMLFEAYDYNSMSSAFIRLYHLKGKKEWLALYIDENPHTPWWGDEERKKDDSVTK